MSKPSVRRAVEGGAAHRAETSHRWVDHTGELELRVEAESEGGVFEEALLALAELLDDGAPPGNLPVRIALSAGDRAALLASWLDELVFRAETEGLVPESVQQLDLGGDRLHAVVLGHIGNPRHLVKATTYHRLRLETADGAGFRATVVFDV